MFEFNNINDFLVVWTRYDVLSTQVICTQFWLLLNLVIIWIAMLCSINKNTYFLISLSDHVSLELVKLLLNWRLNSLKRELKFIWQKN